MVTWKGGTSHSMMLIKEGDNVSILCSQTGQKHGIDELLQRVDADKEIKLLRVDNLQIDPSTVNGIVRVGGRDLFHEGWDKGYAEYDFSKLEKELKDKRLWHPEDEIHSYRRKKGQKLW